jgi:nucleotide-binding universal stress UspA family protein
MTRALLWVTEESWAPVVDAARALLPADADLTLLAVEPADVEELAEGAAAGLLGRGRRPRPHEAIRVAALRAGEEVVAAARERLGRPAPVLARAGRVEREAVAAAAGFDVLVVARDGDQRRPGPRSLGPATRFVVDHAPCALLLVYAGPP